MSGEAHAVQEALTVYTAKTLKIDNVPLGYKQTEVGLIPEEWTIAKLDHLAELTSSRRIFEHEYVSSGVPFYRGKEISLLVNREPIADPYFISEKRYNELVSQYGAPTKGDILITAVGTLGNIYVVPEDSRFYFKDGNLIWLRKITAESEYVAAQLRRARTRIISESIGSSQRALTIVVLKDVQIPMPSPREQRVIAAALSDVDYLIFALDKLITKKRAVKTAAMQQLLTGKQRLPRFSEEWKTRQFADIASPRRERVDPRKVGSQQFCVELEHIESGTGRLLGSTSTRDQSSLKSVFQVGDVLFGKLRSYLRKYWLADRPGVCSTEVWVLSPNRRLVTSEFLFQIVGMDRFVEAASTAYGTHMPRADWNVVKNYELALPGLEEQTAIATVLSDMDAEIAALEARREKTRQVKQGMMQELLTGRTRLIPEGSIS
jgi:type I restriction enzyme S subunit